MLSESGRQQWVTGGSMTGQPGVGAPSSSSFQASMASRSLLCPPPISLPCLTSVGLPPPRSPYPRLSGSSELATSELTSHLHLAVRAPGADQGPCGQTSGQGRRPCSYKLSLHCDTGSSTLSCQQQESWGRSSCAHLHPTLRSHGLQPTRLLCPWDSPGKNTGMGLTFPPRGNLPGPGIKPASSVSPILQAGSLPLSRCGEGQGDQWRNQSGKAPSRLLQQKAKLSSKKNKRREGKHEKRGEEERSHKHLWNKGIFPNVKCTDNLMEFTWFSPFRVWLQKIELQSHHHILDLLQLTCRQEKRTVTSTLRSHGYILNRGGTQTGIQDKLFPSSRKRSCDWAALFNRQIRQ